MTVEAIDAPKAAECNKLALTEADIANAVLFANHLARVRNAVGTTLCQEVIAYNPETGALEDVTDGGKTSCAAVVSSIAALGGLIDEPHATVQSTLAALKASDWRMQLVADLETESPIPGSITLWPRSEEGHNHLGFFVGNGRYVSNVSFVGTPQEHGAQLRDGRLPFAYLDTPRLVSGYEVRQAITSANS